MLRPFWLHQAAEYLIGLVVVAMGLQSLHPTVPTLAGGLIILNAALVDGPLGAFRMFSRRAHRIVDLVVIGILLVLAFLPWLDNDNANRALIAAAAAMLGFVWWNSSFERRRKPQPGEPIDRSEAIGKTAGRAVGGIARVVRDRTNRPG